MKRSKKKLKIFLVKNEESFKEWAKKMEQEGNAFIENWKELSKCKSETYYLKVKEESCNGWIKHKTNEFNFDDYYYLSTHTFYGSNYKESTKALQMRGFKVYLLNWDLESNKY